jgi:hypothetical protein
VTRRWQDAPAKRCHRGARPRPAQPQHRDSGASGAGRKGEDSVVEQSLTCTNHATFGELEAAVHDTAPATPWHPGWASQECSEFVNRSAASALERELTVREHPFVQPDIVRTIYFPPLTVSANRANGDRLQGQ